MLSNHYEFLDDKSIPCGLLTVSCEIEFPLNISCSTNISILTELCEFKNEIHIDSMIELKDVVKEWAKLLRELNWISVRKMYHCDQATTLPMSSVPCVINALT